MVIWISIVIIVLVLYFGIYYLYDEYKTDIKEIKEDYNNLEKKYVDLNGKYEIMKQLVNFLYDEVEGGEKKWKHLE